MSNENKAAPGVTVELGDESRRLAYNWWSVYQVQKLTGKSMLKNELDSENPEHLIALVWAGLIDGDDSLDGGFDADGSPDADLRAGFRRVGKWLSFVNIGEISAAVGASIASYLPEAKKGTKGAGKKRKARS